MKLESRPTDVFAVSSLEIRAAEGDKPARLVGYAALFNSLSKDLGGFIERIMPGAFRACLAAGQDIRALVSHNSDWILGRTSAGTLRISEDAKGLAVEIDMPDTTYARDLAESVKRKDIAGMSFGFRVPEKGERFVTEAGKTIRELLAIDLREVSVTSIPAYGDTSIALRVDPEIAARISAATTFPRFRSASMRLREHQAHG
ncbi:MAG: HK97 family phage prohead protease [Planctomycetes bacterium]|nr:HK97 family phage prohead protease [Planctomycetota bacterium]